jgi:post-segregation antitoxin (ccd killing protein)
VIRGTRIPATLVVGSLAGGMSSEEAQREYDLAPEDVQAALKYVVEIAGDRKKWREENREAIEAYNEYVEKHGAFSDDLRQF